MKKKFFMVAAVTISSQLLAQKDTTTLDPVILTANKFEQKQSQTGKVVTIISKEQLERSAGKTVAQILNEQAGISIAGTYTALGGVQTVFMRGASTGRTLILIDGIPVSDPSMLYNEFDLNLFSINDIERIEICKGAQSTLYGSDAIAGAINIITVKKNVNKSFNLKTTIGFGNKNTFRGNIQGFGKIGKLTYTTRFAKLRTDGFSAANDNTGNRDFDKDGYDGNVVNAAVQYQVIPSLLVKTFIQHSRYKADVDNGVFSDDKDYTIHNSYLSSGAGFNLKKGIVNITGNYQYGDLKRRYLNDSLYPRNTLFFMRNNYGGMTQYAELYGNIAATEWLTILIGSDYRWADMNQQFYSVSSFGPFSSDFKDTSAHQTSVYGSLLLNALNKRLNVEIGGRINNHSRYGNNGTYTFNPSFLINRNLRIFGSFASGFKAPSIYQVYDVFSGNRDLKPEKSKNYEIGVQENHEKISTRLVYFHRDIKNGIDYNYSTFKYFNFVKQTVDGLEAELFIKPVKQLSITANYSLITGEEITQSRKSFKDTTYGYMLRRPKNSFNVSIGYQVCDDFYISVSGKFVSSRYDIGGYAVPDVLLDGYFLLNAYAEYKWKNVKFFTDLQNIAGKKFFDLRGYNAIPFMINGGITFEL
ncbi:MAG TPA: TonB-dependent receptor [Chitinophagaceae bacterium]|nr:TonB-dependent receptor [Chitinophagaceae bacterium]